jgi:6-phosphogluconolactonase
MARDHVTTRIRVSATASDSSSAAAQEFARIVIDAVDARDTCVVALAGGSTPRQLYRTLAESDAVRSQLPWSRIEFFWGDERCVPPDHPDSNFRMASETLFSSAPVESAQIHRIRTEASDASTAAREYEAEILATVPHESGIPRFDLILLGLGTDGHTASLFPGTTALAERQRFCVDTWVEHLNARRITMTLPLINAARTVMFIVSGVEKAPVVRAVLQPQGEATLPAQLVQPEGDLLWFLDRLSASQMVG